VVKQTVTLFTSAGRPFNWYAFTILSDAASRFDRTSLRRNK
jgi:hypothetical protein